MDAHAPGTKRHRKFAQRLVGILILLGFTLGLLIIYPFFTRVPTTHAAGSSSVQINAGGPAVAPFIADTDFTGGMAGASTSNTITTTGVTNPAPQAVYQTNHVGPSFSYTIPNLASGAAYTVRLHFAETYWTQAGQRTFNVSINSQSVLSKFDIVATAGGANKAVVKEFTATAGGSGTITIQFTSVVDQAQINGIEVLATSSTPMPTPTSTSTTANNVVRVTGTQGNWQLTVNGSPYQVKGVTFGPSSSTALSYMPELQAMGVNTLRTWGTDSTTQPLLDAASAYGIKVINGFWLNQNADYVNDTNYKTTTLTAIKNTVSTYKNSPGVLMWDVGNEVILSLQNYYSGTQLEQERNAYAQYVDQVAQAIHSIDPSHPVTSTDAYTGAWAYYKVNSPHLDLYAVNAYGSACNVKQNWISGGYTKPYIVTESGPAGEWEVPNDKNGVPTEPTDVQKSQGYATAWNCITSHTGVALGATLFNYGIENDFGGVWFNLIPGHLRRLSDFTVARLYGGKISTNTPPVISNMTLNNTTVSANGQLVVNANVSDPNGDPLRYQLMLCSKYIDGSTVLQNATFTQTGSTTFSVTAPTKTGVWKVYLYAYDGQGNVGIETLSFKVV